MNAAELMEKIGESLGGAATVKSVFGEPIHLDGKTVVPVAKIALGFGAGSGAGKRFESGPVGEGGGGGGGVRAFPAGALEITARRTRFIPFTDFRLVAAAFVAGAVLSKVLWRRHRH